MLCCFEASKCQKVALETPEVSIFFASSCSATLCNRFEAFASNICLEENDAQFPLHLSLSDTNLSSHSSAHMVKFIFVRYQHMVFRNSYQV